MVQKIKWLILAAVIVFPGGLFASDYAHKLAADDITVSWTLDQDKIHMQLSASTTGWVSIGIDPEDAMGGADIIIGAVKNDKVRIEDHFADRKRGHSVDEKLGGNNHVMNPEGSEADGVTTISFTRSVDAAEKWDKPINTSGKTRVMIAYGTGRDSFISAHRYRAVFDIDFSTGEAVQIK
ncbi:MAG: DOMON domain-containing protein [Desulfotignum sp.]|nr:DOMON domain-containing protein [Desulfotignum sp.]